MSIEYQTRREKKTKPRSLKIKKRMQNQTKTDYLVRAFATGFGAGRMPLAPGTWGAAEGLLLVILVHHFLPSIQLAVIWAMFIPLGILAVLAADRMAVMEEDPDPQNVVADEMVGQMVCFLWVPITPATLVLGFILFRVFDISKPFPAGRAEHLPGGFGIIGDDLIAGVYAGLVITGINYFR